MKSILFFSDINNTITPAPFSSDTEYMAEIGLFVDNLEEIKRNFEAEKIFVSFSTSFLMNQYEVVEKIIKLINEQVSKKNINLELTTVFMKDCVLHFDDNDYSVCEKDSDDRCIQLGRHISELNSASNEVVWAGYADDQYPRNGSVARKLNFYNLTNYYNGFMPTCWGNKPNDDDVFVSSRPAIAGLNEAVGNFVLEKKHVKK